MGAAQFLGNGKPEGNLSITFEYPPENDLLKRQQILKQQNHYMYHKDSYQMQKQIPPILRKRAKSQPQASSK